MRWVGTTLVALGTMVLAVDLDRGDIVVVSVAASHGLHLSDALGLIAICAGVVLLLLAPRSAGHGSREA